MTSEHITAYKEEGMWEESAGGGKAPWGRAGLGRVCPLVCHHAVDLMDGRGKGAKADLLRLVDDLRPGLLPLLGHHQVFVGVDQQVEST